MRILNKNDFPLNRPTAVAIGLFDGVHLGHAVLLDDVKHKNGLKSAVYTFDSKPAVSGHIYTEQEKQSIFASGGLDFYFSRNFNKKFADLSPEIFLEEMVRDLCARHITVGYDFRFGKNAMGDIEHLNKSAARLGYSLSVIPEVDVDGYKVSSSLIRDMIQRGDVEEAARLLGRFYFADGRIEHGKKLGNKIGFPTANVTTQKLLPAFGVYVTLVLAQGKIYRSVSNVGVKPTVQDSGKPNIETFILDFADDIYGKEIRVFFLKKLRSEVKFASIEDMKGQIAEDSRMAKEELRDLSVYKPYLLC